MADRHQRVRVLQRGRGGRRDEPPAGGEPPLRPPAATRDVGSPRCPEIRFHPAPGIEVHVRFLPQASSALLDDCQQSNVHGQEVCGLLVGTVAEKQRDSQVRELEVSLTNILPLETSDASGAHVSAGPEAWARAGEQLEAHFPGKKRLGWYHTHPTQGIFFSDQDRDFHTVFTQPYQFALVVDPRSEEIGIFFWLDRGQGRISTPLRVNLTPPPERAVLQAWPQQSQRVRSTRGSRLHPWVLFSVALLGFAGLVASAEADEPRLATVSTLFAAAFSLRLWNRAAQAPARDETPRPPRREGATHERPWGLALLAFSLVALLSSLLLFVLPAILPSRGTPAADATTAQPPPAPPPAERQADGPPPPPTQPAAASATPAAPAAPIASSAGAATATSADGAAPEIVRLKLGFQGNSSQLVLSWHDDRPGTDAGEVKYFLGQDGELGAEQGEAALFSHLVTRGAAPSVDQLKSCLQSYLRIRADGIWRSASRRAFIASLRASIRRRELGWRLRCGTSTLDLDLFQEGG